MTMYADPHQYRQIAISPEQLPDLLSRLISGTPGLGWSDKPIVVPDPSAIVVHDSSVQVRYHIYWGEAITPDCCTLMVREMDRVGPDTYVARHGDAKIQFRFSYGKIKVITT